MFLGNRSNEAESERHKNVTTARQTARKTDHGEVTSIYEPACFHRSHKFALVLRIS